MFVRNKMTTRPFTVSPDATIIEANEIMEKNAVKRLPVVKDGRRRSTTCLQRRRSVR